MIHLYNDVDKFAGIYLGHNALCIEKYVTCIGMIERYVEIDKKINEVFLLGVVCFFLEKHSC